ncbi:S-layer homology domain-containing protein [Paenibacillus filicis]|uniref:S-layer homology domain-containing protein n=1 Tax=Paenibacillus filicis TaxID=669464 RepID=A0ABU9DK11_9BACL
MGKGLFRAALLACAALLAAGSVPVGAGIVHGAGQEAEVRLGSIAGSYRVKDEISVPILALGTRELMGIEVVVRYDPSVLDYIPGKLELPGGFKAADPNSNIIIDEQNGILKYALIKSQLPGTEPVPEIRIASLHFEALKPADATSLKLEEILATTGYQRIPTNAQDVRQMKINPGSEGGGDVTKPEIQVESASRVKVPLYTLKGTVTDNDPKVSLTINGKAVPLNGQAFEQSYTLSEGANRFELVATDSSGNRRELTFTVVYDPGSEDPDTTKPVIRVDSSASVNRAEYALKGTVTDNDPNVKLTINGTAVALEQQAFAHAVTLTEGDHSFVLVATDTAGNRQELTFVVTYKKSGGGDGTGGPGGNNGNGSGPSGGSVVTVPSESVPLSKPGLVSQLIRASAGGTVQLAGGAKAVIPAGALAADTTVTIRRITDPATLGGLLPNGLPLQLHGDVYAFEAKDDVRLLQPAAFTLPWSESLAQGGTQPAVYYYHEGRKQWIYLGGQLHAAEGTLTVQAGRFRTLAVFTDPSVVSFTDTDGHWASGSITRLAGMKVINGYEDGTFRPEHPVTRIEFTAMMVSALGLTVDSSPVLSFADADQIPGWAKGYVQAAADAGIIEGRTGASGEVYVDGDARITRAEMAVMIARAMKTDGPGAALHFADADFIPDWAKSSIERLVEKGIINGFEDDTFRPDGNATRAQAATMIDHLLGELGI